MEQAVSDMGFDASVAPLVRRMELVDGYRASLLRLQDVWDQLTLLGQMSGIATDITDTAAEFRALSRTLLNSLAQRVLTSTLHRMQAQAQVAIDILVRNLFERTADVGFLATDSAVRAFLHHTRSGAGDLDARRDRLQARFEAYVAKYSVYAEVIVLAPDGRVCARLDRSVAVDHCRHRLVADSLAADTPFVESFGALDLLGGRRGLVYSAAVRAPGGEVLGILCLSFRFDDEMQSIFTHLAPVGPCSVVVLRDAAGGVLASSDAWQVPVGARLPPAIGAQGQLFFAGREYLAVEVSATGYQGYPGPGWRACTLVPIEQAFRADASRASHGDAPLLPPGSLTESELFADELRSIPQQARRIQRGLERSVWNGEVRGRRRADAVASAGFGAALLHQVTDTGERIKRVIEDAIGDLQQSAAASILDEARACSAFAIDIMDRNLYERANDCRWWALDGTLQRVLAATSATPATANAGAASAGEAAKVLAHINSLYTVYASLLLLDARGGVVAASNAAGEAWVGRTVEAGWVGPALQLRDGQAHVRSGFEASPLYGGRSTYVYAAAVQPDGGPVTGPVAGAVAIVFDGEPQFEAMLRDTLPRNAEGAVMRQATGLFVTRGGRVVSSTDTARFPVGQTLAFQPELAALTRGASHHWVLKLGGAAYAAGVSMSRGYREYNSDTALHDDDVACVVLVQLGEQQAAAEDSPATARAVAPQRLVGGDKSRQIASFYCAGEWLALDSRGVIEAINVPHLTALPGSPAAVAGVVMHGNEAVPVIDLRSVRNRAPSAAPGGSIPVILCQSPGHLTFGLQVDELGQVMDIPSSAVRPVQGYLATHDRHAEGVLSFSGEKNHQMLTLLCVDRLASGFAARA
jgi:chemotaxis signal transduction protein